MKIEVEISENGIIQYLQEVARDQIWHINATIKSLRNNYTDNDKPTFLLKDLQDFYATLDSTNKLIEYHGGDPVEVICANVIPGYDLEGNPFKNTP